MGAKAAGRLNVLTGRWGPQGDGDMREQFLWRSTKQLYTWVKLDLFHLAFEMLVSYARKPTLKANSCFFSSTTLLSLVAH